MIKKSFIAQKVVNRRISTKLMNLFVSYPYSILQNDMGELADIIDVDRDQLSYYFRVVLMTRYSIWRNSMRIEKSKQLMLLYPRMPLARVCEVAGFEDLSNFRRTFKSMTGVFPSEWKKKVMKE